MVWRWRTHAARKHGATASHMTFNGELRHIDFHRLIGKRVTIYGQQEVVKDLIARRLADGGEIHFEVTDTSVHDFTDRQALKSIHFHRPSKRKSNATSLLAVTVPRRERQAFQRRAHWNLNASIPSVGLAS
jgi:hypothetical protein